MGIFSFTPPEVRSQVPRVVISGAEQVLIEQHRGLFSYDPARIRLRTAAGLITIEGEGLVIAHFGLEDVLVQGRIRGIGIGEDGQ